MTAPMSVPAHARATLVLGLPLIGSHLAQIALHVTDTIMLGWYGVNELAAVVLGATTFFTLFHFGTGFAHAVMPMVAAALGEGDQAKARRVARMGLWLSVGFGIAIYPLFWFSGPILLAIGQDPAVAALAQDYMRLVGPGMILALMVMTLKAFLAALGLTQVVLWSTLAGVALNAALNWVLIFGNWGAPELGLTGAAIATLATQTLTLIILAIYAALQQKAATFRIWQRIWRPDMPALVQVWRIGAPIGVQGLAEGGLFAATAYMIGTLGPVPLAAHGIAMEITSVLFMLHVGLSNAATIRTGYFDGAGQPHALRMGAVAALILSAIAALCATLLFLAVPEALMGVFLDNARSDTPAIIAAGVALLTVAAVYQLVDAGQVMAMGLLRGLRDTRVPMIIAVLSYWAVGIPASWLIGLHMGYGAPGVWTGLVIGLALAATLLLTRFWRRVRQR